MKHVVLCETRGVMLRHVDVKHTCCCVKHVVLCETRCVVLRRVAVKHVVLCETRCVMLRRETRVAEWCWLLTEC